MADVRELGRRVKQKFPGEYDNIDDAELGRQVKAKYPNDPLYSQFTDTPAQPQPQGGFLDNVSNAAQQGYLSLKDKAAALGEIAGGIATGDFRPAIEAGQQIVRGAAPIVAALGRPDAGPRYLAESIAQAGPIAEVEARQAARRQASGDTSFAQRAQRMSELEAQAQASDPSLSGRLTRGIVREGIKLAPTVIAGIASGGSVPAIAGATALSSFDEPQNLVTNTALSAVPVPSVRAIKAAVSPVVSRVLGRGAAQIVEAEARSAPAALTGQAQQALPGFEAAVAEAAGQVPQSMTRKVLGNTLEAYRLIRAAKTSGDVSAPLRQGALITLSPSQWVNGNVPRAAVRMFKAFRTKDYEKIQQAIGADADGQLAQRMGLDLTTQATETGLRRTEEAFLSKWADKIPVIRHSEQAYKTFLDSVRLTRFKEYKRAIDNAGLNAEQTERGYRAASAWLNTITGRGSFGATADKALPVLGEILFAPRNVASRLQILNPGTYARNAGTVEGRIVLKQQMADLLQFAGVVAGTLQLAKLAGAEVNTDANSSDFLKIRIGNWRYDMLAGVQQAMRLVYRVGADLNRAAQGEKAPKGEGALDIAGRFLRSKLAPAPAFFTDMLARRTYTGQPFSAQKQIAELYAPLQWADFVEAYQREGFGGVLKSSPGLVGLGVQHYDRPGGFLDKAQPVLTEYQRLGRQLPEIRRTSNEGQEQFNGRVKVFGQALQQFGVQLVESEPYRNATDEQKKAALNLLPRRISGALMKQNEQWLLRPDVIMADVRDSQQLRQERR